ncbi:MAG: CBS domain-containing protein [Gemmataceae bacterium]|nr:CBS domain-containing protein [Gemmataceae bacterium]
MELARNLKVESVERLRPSAAATLPANSTVADAVSLMCLKKVGCVLVCQGGFLRGIFSERDLIRRVLAVNAPMSTPLEKVMTPKPVTVTLSDSISTAIHKMLDGGYRHLPVVDENQMALGTLSVKRIIHHLAEHFPTAVFNLPPGPARQPPRAEGA